MNKKTIALGIDDFKRVVEGNYYLIDKTLFIKEIVEDGAAIILLPRPRRWGKTMNMTMLKYFFEKTTESNQHLFADLAIAQQQQVMAHQGQYPVIFISFKAAKKSTWPETWEIIKKVLIEEHKRHKYLIESDSLDQCEKDDFIAILMGTAPQHLFESSLKNLSTYLHRFHKKRPFILIDEYDSPIHAGFIHHYYRDVINFMSTFLEMALKGNNDLEKGILTGILRVAKESIFSGLNNISVNTLLNTLYADHFGFSESEVAALLDYYDETENSDQVRAWYNGYSIGKKTTMYNPWSVLSYARSKEFKAHWMNSANNNLIKEIIQKNPADFKVDFEQLLLGKTIEKDPVEFVTFDSIYTSPHAAFNFLLLTGYLSFKQRLNTNDDEALSLVIPNKEVMIFYKNSLKEWIQESLDFSTYQNMLKSLTSGDLKDFKKTFERVVQQSLSFHDVSGKEPEKFYHMFVLGMLICLESSHQVLSNRESGNGRYDVMIIPKDPSKIGIIIEFKIADNETDPAFDEATLEALAQIKEKNYQAELKSRGITQIINVAIVFAGKRVLVTYE
jgi:hypothetical protein